MAFELHTSTPSLLREGQWIQFVGGWPEAKDNKWFRVDRAQQLRFDVPRIVLSGASIDLDFSVPAGGGVGNTNLSLIPQKVETVYEMLLGLKGLPLIYPMYNNSYYLKLEATSVVPDTGDANLRYLGNYDEDDSPLEAPRLREHVVKDQQPPVLRLYNDGFVDEPVVLRFIINKLYVTLAPAMSEEMRQRGRIVRYHTMMSW